jgi:hypothetical protein
MARQRLDTSQGRAAKMVSIFAAPAAEARNAIRRWFNQDGTPV